MKTHATDFFHRMSIRQSTVDVMLKMSEMNQKMFVVSAIVPFWLSENPIATAVMLEKKVAIVVIFMYRVVALSFSSATNMGKATGKRD